MSLVIVSDSESYCGYKTARSTF